MTNVTAFYESFRHAVKHWFLGLFNSTCILSQKIVFCQAIPSCRVVCGASYDMSDTQLSNCLHHMHIPPFFFSSHLLPFFHQLLALKVSVIEPAYTIHTYFSSVFDICYFLQISFYMQNFYLEIVYEQPLTYSFLY